MKPYVEILVTVLGGVGVWYFTRDKAASTQTTSPTSSPKGLVTPSFGARTSFIRGGGGATVNPNQLGGVANPTNSFIRTPPAVKTSILGSVLQPRARARLQASTRDTTRSYATVSSLFGGAGPDTGVGGYATPHRGLR